MFSNNKPNLEEVNYRKVNEGEPNCIQCNHSDTDIEVTNNAVVISKCYFFNMNVDELHICDLIH